MGREIFLCCVHVRTGRNTNKGVVNVSCSILALLGHARLDDGAERKGRAGREEGERKEDSRDTEPWIQSCSFREIVDLREEGEYKKNGDFRIWLGRTYRGVMLPDCGIYDADVGVYFTGFGYALFEGDEI